MYFLYLLVGFFSIIGLITVIKSIAMWFLKLENACCTTSLLMLINDCEKSDVDLETKIALSRLRWYNMQRYDNVYIVGRGLSEDNFRLCEDHCRKTDVKLLNFSEFTKIINESGSVYD